MLTLKGRIMPASNATFLAELADGREVVYKPIAGERPLWDFPDGTLAGREVAAYLVSEATGWGIVPRTWIGDGPHGRGMVQEWQTVGDDDAVSLVPGGDVPDGWLPVVEGYDERDHPVTLIHEDTEALRRMAVFDAVVNNADRKGGHVLAMADGRRLGVDHGVTFHHENKLRTVLWGWAGSDLRDDEAAMLTRLEAALAGELGSALAEHLAGAELRALSSRVRRLLQAGRLPLPSDGWPSIPWPPF
ncbi:MAG TPA: SCO1664 family protein [Nocardioides sp.]|nr:SCO1664 family protein [Nocardioides sp.]